MLEIANSVDYGLTAGILSDDINQALVCLVKYRPGTSGLTTRVIIIRVPFGGYKDSELGKEECLEEMLAYTQVKAINVHLR